LPAVALAGAITITQRAAAVLAVIKVLCKVKILAVGLVLYLYFLQMQRIIQLLLAVEVLALDSRVAMLLLEIMVLQVVHFLSAQQAAVVVVAHQILAKTVGRVVVRAVILLVMVILVMVRLAKALMAV
tara:strand:- start:272 stop:655 length:384 start_codon:yes stop_codon:yes gene_type:complete